MGSGDSPAQDLVVAAAVRGDSRAMQALWQTHRRWIAAVLLAHKPRHEDLEDLLQEVAMTLVQKINTLREHGNIRAWLRTVAINAARASARSGKYRSQPPLGDHDPADEESDVDGQSDQREHMSRMMEAVSQLPDIYREPLLLRAVQGMRSKRIADVLDIPAATVDTRIARARSMLRAALTAADENGDDMKISGAAAPLHLARTHDHECLP